MDKPKQRHNLTPSHLTFTAFTTHIFLLALAITFLQSAGASPSPVYNTQKQNLKNAHLPVHEDFTQIGGSITTNPFPTPTIVNSIHLESVQINSTVLQAMLSNCYYVQVFFYRPYQPKSVFDLSLVAQMPYHEFTVLIMDQVTVQFPHAPSAALIGQYKPLAGSLIGEKAQESSSDAIQIPPINAKLQVTFYDSILPADFTQELQRWFPIVNTLNLVEIQLDLETGVGNNELEFLLSGEIETLRHLYIREFNRIDSGQAEKLQQIFEQLGCPNVRDYVFLDKDYDLWEC